MFLLQQTKLQNQTTLTETEQVYVDTINQY